MQNGGNIVVLAIDAFAFKSFSSTALTSNKNPQPDENQEDVIYTMDLFFS